MIDMKAVADGIHRLITGIDELRYELDQPIADTEKEVEWGDDIGEKLVEAQDTLREALLLIDEGPDEDDENEEGAEDEDEAANDNPA